MKRLELLGIQINKPYINNSSCVWSTSTLATMDTSVLSSTKRHVHTEFKGTRESFRNEQRWNLWM